MTVVTEEGNPAVDRLGFRRCLSQFGTGVTVIAASRDGTPAGLTCNSFSSLSLEPPLVAWALRRESASFGSFVDCSHFSVNVLAADQMDVSQRFAKSGLGKFEGLPFEPGLGEAPLLAGVSASFECVRVTVHEAGDHVLVVGRVERYRRCERPPLLFAQGRYAVAMDHPSAVAAAGAAVASAPAPPLKVGEEMMTSLFIRAYAKLVPAQSSALEEAGLSLVEARLLRAVQTSPEPTLEQLQPELLFGIGLGEAVLGGLAARGLLAVDAVGRLHLTAQGDTTLQQVLARAGRLEADSLQAFTPADVATVRRILSGIVNS